AQAILLEESGLFKLMMNALAGSPGMSIVEHALEAAILEEFREIDRLGGVLAATELRYQRSQIQAAAHRYERQINDGLRPIIGWNRYGSRNASMPEVKVVRTPRAKKQLQIDRLAKFKRTHRDQAARALDRLGKVVGCGGNSWPAAAVLAFSCSSSSRLSSIAFCSGVRFGSRRMRSTSEAEARLIWYMSRADSGLPACRALATASR